MATRQWNISIVETDERLEARMTNMDTGESSPLLVVYIADYDSRDEAVGELFGGDMPNIRDSFDTFDTI